MIVSVISTLCLLLVPLLLLSIIIRGWGCPLVQPDLHAAVVAAEDLPEDVALGARE